MRFLPQSPQFFDLFEELATFSIKTSVLLPSKSKGAIDWKKLAESAHKLENKADDLCHKILQEADKTFITPIDREDIQALAKNIDNIIDLTENVISNMHIYNVKRIKPDFYKFSSIVTKATKEVHHLVSDLRHKGTNTKEMRQHVLAVHSFENQGDILLSKSLQSLFSNGTNTLDIIKWKDIYENLEQILDECENTSDTVETIIIKNF